MPSGMETGVALKESLRTSSAVWTECSFVVISSEICGEGELLSEFFLSVLFPLLQEQTARLNAAASAVKFQYDFFMIYPFYDVDVYLIHKL